MSEKFSADAVHRAAEITSQGGGGNSEQEHRLMAAEARRIEREASEKPRAEKQKAEPQRQRVEVTTRIRHD